jgi:hypothetical protein
MMKAGLAIRHAQALEAAAAEACPECGHPRGEHFELSPSTLTIEGGQLVEEPNPAYRAFHFHCRHDGCACVLDRTGDG